MGLKSIIIIWATVTSFTTQTLLLPVYAHAQNAVESKALVKVQAQTSHEKFKVAAGVSTPYDLLNVARTSTTAEITAAYRKLARELHPDKWSNADPLQKKQAEEAFKLITEAYNILKDPDTRSHYDSQMENFTRASKVKDFYGPGKHWKPVTTVEGHLLGGFGFSGAMILHSLLKAWHTNDPAIWWAMKDSFKDPRSSAMLLTFGGFAQLHTQIITGEVSLIQKGLSKLPNIVNKNSLRLQSFLKGKPRLTSGIAMGLAAASNRLMQRLLYSTGWTDFSRFEKEIDYWTNKELEQKGITIRQWSEQAGIAFKLRNELIALAVRKKSLESLLKNNPEYLTELQQVAAEVEETRKEFKKIEDQHLKPAREARWNALMKVTSDLVAINPEGFAEVGLELSRLMLTIATINLIPEFWSKAGKKVASSSKYKTFIASIGESRFMQVFSREIVSRINGFKREQLPSFIKFKNHFTLESLLDADIEIKAGTLSGGAAAGRRFAGKLGIYSQSLLRGSLHGLLFLTVDELIGKISNSTWETASLPHKLNKKLGMLPTQVSSFLNMSSIEEGNLLADQIKQSLTEYSATWNMYRDDLILPKFYEHYTAWNKMFLDMEMTYYRKYEYLNWLAAGGRFDDPYYQDNGKKTNRPPWHRDENMYSDYESEIAEMQSYVDTAQSNVKLVRTNQGVDAKGLNVVIVNKYLLNEKSVLVARQESENRRLQKHLKPILDQLYFTKKTPILVKSVNTLAKAYSGFLGIAYNNDIIRKVAPTFRFDDLGYKNAPFNLFDSFIQEIQYLIENSTPILSTLERTDLVKHLDLLRKLSLQGQYKLSTDPTKFIEDIKLLLQGATTLKAQMGIDAANGSIMVDKKYLSNVVALHVVDTIQTALSSLIGLNDQYSMMLTPTKIQEPPEDALPAMTSDELIEEMLNG